MNGGVPGAAPAAAPHVPPAYHQLQLLTVTLKKKTDDYDDITTLYNAQTVELIKKEAMIKHLLLRHFITKTKKTSKKNEGT